MYNYNYANPFGFQPALQSEQVLQVNGENGARAVNLAPNSSKLALDMSGLILWLITTDGAGYKTVTPYDITPHKVEAAPDFSSLEDRITKLEKDIGGLIHELTGDSSTAKSK